MSLHKQNEIQIGQSDRMALHEMYQEILFLFRGIEAVRLVEHTCDKCHLRRSNAIRRKKKKDSTFTRVKSAKNEFERCIKTRGLLDSVEELEKRKSFER